MNPVLELEVAFQKSTDHFLNGEIEEGEYLVRVRDIYRRVQDLKKRGIKP